MIPNDRYHTYAQVDLSTSVATATPLRLIQILYEGALKSIRAARAHMKQQNISGKAEAIAKTIAIIEELNACLNHEVGGDISTNLEALYGYMTKRLVEGNLKNDTAPIEEVEKLLSGLREAWVELANLPEDALKPQTGAPR
ncbi:MAG: flagellar export chaperone FliS [Nitrospiria bacterium]